MEKALFTDVMKNDTIKKMAKIEMISDMGMTLNISKMVNSVDGIVKSVSLFFWISIAVVPNAENQNVPSNVGATSTPIMNSLIVRPFDTRAMNILTNGAHEIHQAQ